MFETVNTAFANVASLQLLITLPAPNGDSTCFVFVYISICVQGLNKFLYYFSDQNLSLVIVLSLFLIFGQISACVLKFVLIKKKSVHTYAS